MHLFVDTRNPETILPRGSRALGPLSIQTAVAVTVKRRGWPCNPQEHPFSGFRGPCTLPQRYRLKAVLMVSVGRTRSARRLEAFTFRRKLKSNEMNVVRVKRRR